jgi:hypothetical protein
VTIKHRPAKVEKKKVAAKKPAVTSSPKGKKTVKAKSKKK